MHRINTKLALSWAVLGLGCWSPAQAGSYTTSAVSTPLASGYEIVSDPLFSSIGRSGAGFLAMAETSIGVNKIYAQGAFTEVVVIGASSVWSVEFDLTGAAPGTPIDLRLSIAYDFSLGLGGDGSAGFAIEINGNHPSPYDAYTITNPFGADRCFDRPGVTNNGGCSGAHSGVLNLILPYTAGLNRTLSVLTAGGTSNTAVMDAFHTARVTGITVPDGIGWTYVDLAGNPLNFQNASTSGVPEPATMGLLGLGLGALLVRRARKSETR